LSLNIGCGCGKITRWRKIGAHDCVWIERSRGRRKTRSKIYFAKIYTFKNVVAILRLKHRLGVLFLKSWRLRELLLRKHLILRLVLPLLLIKWLIVGV
jgi:hypothetical protein